MAFNTQAAQATPSSGLQHSLANSPAPQDHVAPTTLATNDAIRNVSPSSASSAGDAAGRKMKRTGAAKQLVKRSPYGQAPPPPWATSLLGGRASLGSLTRTPSSAQGPAAQPTSIVDTPGDTSSTDFSIRQSGSESSGPSRSRSPEPARIETDNDQSEPEDLLVANLETTSSEGTPGTDMAGKKPTLAEHAKIQALQDTWVSGSLAPVAPGIAESAGEKDWLGGVSVHGDSASSSRKRVMPENMASNETNKRRMTAVPVPVIPNKASFDQTSTTSELMTTERDLMNAVYAADADQAMDDDQTAEERESNVSEPKTASIDTEADNPFSQGLGEFHVTRGPDPRGYSQWRTPQGTESSCGTILPTNYQLYPNPQYPLICPVRNCRILFHKMNSLGAHFCAKHRSSKFNDNLDGTLSFVDYYKKAGARYTPPIVVSQKPLRGDEPPMPEPVPKGTRLATAMRPLSPKAMITSPYQIRMPMVPINEPRPPDSPPRRVTRHSLASKLVVAEAGPSSLPAPARNSLAGNPMPSNMLEMEDWEVAPGRLRDEQSESPTNVAFSNSYLTTNQAVTVSEDIFFNVIVIKPGDSYHWPEEADKVRICSIATGKLKVKLDNAEAFLMGFNGMFKLKPGMACTVENRLYVDSVVHVTTV
ncbi:hypothetical protein CSHISOI_06173, partial [Colletotrichum shisoi]